MNILQRLTSGEYDGALKALYGERLESAKERYKAIAEKYEERFGASDNASFFSVPGRTEILGNHTDHQRGCVIAAPIDLDIAAAASVSDDGKIILGSQGFGEDTVDIGALSTVDEDKFTSRSIIRGVCDGFLKNGYKIGGFRAYSVSDVLKGSGLSSSAAFEVMVGNILNGLYNDGKIPPAELARIAQYAENVHFGKPSGLMDQMACAVGGLIAIDFRDAAAKVEKIPFDISEKGYSICIVNTGGSHADLNDDYASVTFEMKGVAKALGGEVLRDIGKEKIIGNIKDLRQKLGDRAVLRALHFENENERVTQAVNALKNNDLGAFLKRVRSSGLSSSTMLQNIYSVKNVGEQGLSLALALMPEFFRNADENTYAYRVHGGGFAGTVQAFMPDSLTKDFSAFFDSVFGENATYVLKVRRYGAVRLENM